MELWRHFLEVISPSDQKVCGYIGRVMGLQLRQITDGEPPSPKIWWLYRPGHGIAAASDY